MARQEKRKLPKAWERVQKDTQDITDLKRIVVKKEDVAFLKRERTIRLIDKQRIESKFASQSTVIDYVFNNLPEWMIPFIRVHSLLETEEGYELDNRLVFNNFTEWRQITTTDYRFRYVIRGEHTHVITESPLSVIVVPLYITVDLVFLNDFVWHQIQEKRY